MYFSLPHNQRSVSQCITFFTTRIHVLIFILYFEMICILGDLCLEFTVKSRYIEATMTFLSLAQINKLLCTEELSYWWTRSVQMQFSGLSLVWKDKGSNKSTNALEAKQLGMLEVYEVRLHKNMSWHIWLSQMMVTRQSKILSVFFTAYTRNWHV